MTVLTQACKCFDTYSIEKCGLCLLLLTLKCLSWCSCIQWYAAKVALSAKAESEKATEFLPSFFCVPWGKPAYMSSLMWRKWDLHEVTSVSNSPGWAPRQEPASIASHVGNPVSSGVRWLQSQLLSDYKCMKLSKQGLLKWALTEFLTHKIVDKIK